MNTIEIDEIVTTRPSKITNQLVKKLKKLFAMGCSVIEACLYTEIISQIQYN